MFRQSVFLLCLVYVAVANGQQAVGDSCTVWGQFGACARPLECPGYLDRLSRGQWSYEEICSFEDKIPIVCCVGYIPTTTASSVATSSSLGTTTTEYIPLTYDYQTNLPAVEECAPLRPDQTAKKTGQKAWDNCIDYHEQLVRPCERSVALIGGMIRANNCQHNDEVLVGSSTVLREAVSHVALLGYELRNGTMVWPCSGTLLSDRYILTAAHCRFGGISRNKSYAMVGSRIGKEDIDEPQIHRMQRIIRHPLYKNGYRRHDIALIMTETRISLDQWTVPACLDVFGGDYSKAVAPSWLRSRTDFVKTVSLNQFTTKQCRQRLLKRRGMKLRLDTATQICYGDYNSPSDTYQRHTGGPLVIKNPMIHCMYSVVGVTSLAKRFKSKIPGIYMKVAHYVPWIESVVWA